jgi:uncharacterized 2Fe-2S/4Fe-4S cluster protein (DUF4445 family)
MKVVFHPGRRTVEVDGGTTLLEAARRAGLALENQCGGLGTCGNCKVLVLRGRVNPPSGIERETLSRRDLEHGLRLACQTWTRGPKAEILLLPHSLVMEQRYQLEGASAGCKPDPLPQSSGLRGKFGLAIDLGTSKIALFLLELSTGVVAGTAGLMNPQLPFGEDVISRLGYALEGEEQAGRLRDAVVSGINRGLGPLCEGAGVRPLDIARACLVGNTAMHHLFLGLPVRQLAFNPYVPALSHTLELPAGELGLDILPEAAVLLPSPLAGFVGSDHLAALLSTRLDRGKGVSLLIDLGTNTEIALKVPEGITCCSCASGPAFEGGSLTHGMRAAPGAIEEVEIDGEGKLHVGTVDGAEPAGICGSGVLSALAAMREAGIMDEGGRLLEGHPAVASEGGQLVFRISLPSRPGGAEGGNGWIGLSQDDVREVQKSKGAVRAGVEMLLEHAGLTPSGIDRVFLAGGFGNYVNPADLLDLAMLPSLSLSDIVQVGNAAGVGAREMLISRRMRERAECLAEKVRYVELATYPRNELFFASSMLLSEEAVQAYMRKWRKS